METTTLVTFRMTHPSALTVELLGSWDNFAKPYPMQRDSRKGREEWMGCYTFQDIICDGDASYIHEKRSGGLKMGGTYWYYYRINGDEDYFNQDEPSTSACPLLPGQTMNVLEVPEDVKRPGLRSRSSSISFSFTTQTLNPDDRFTNPRPVPAPPKPRLPKLITPATLEAPGFKFDSLPQRDRPWTAVSPSTDPRSNLFPKMRRDIKSTSGSPSTALKSAFAHVRTQSLPSALTPSQGGRGRSRVLHSTHISTDRTNDPSIRELRDRSWTPFSASSENPSAEASPIETPESPMELAPDGMSLLPKYRTISPHRLVRAVVELSSPIDLVDIFPDPSTLRIRGRSVSSMEQRHSGGINRRSRHSEDWPARRSSSLGRRREPSPLRHVVSHSFTQDDLDSRIPEGIMEVDNEDLMSPRKALHDVPKSNERTRSAYSPTQVAMTGLEPPAQPTSTVSSTAPNLEKDLPPLPSYLIPKPLFSSPAKETSPIESAIEAMKDAFSPRSHFSVWSAVSNDGDDQCLERPESPATDHVENSPTFSSIKDSESGACTPHRLSGPGLESQSPFVYPPEAFCVSIGPENITANTVEVPNDMQLDGKTPTAASFALESSGVDMTLNDSFGSLPLRPKTANKDDTQPMRQLTPMEQLLNDFDYLGAALI